jgi:hypothetical protein
VLRVLVHLSVPLLEFGFTSSIRPAARPENPPKVSIALTPGARELILGLMFGDQNEEDVMLGGDQSPATVVIG